MPENTLSERQAQIVDVAMQIIATEGARCFTTQRLASEIGVTSGAIYRHFESMEAIVDAVIERMGAILFEGFPPVALDPIDRLGLFFQRRTRTIGANPHLSRLLLSDRLSQAAGSAQAKRLDEFKRRSQAFVVGCLREAEQNGLLAAEVGPEAAAVMVLGAILALSHTTVRITSARPIEQLSADVWTALERALRARNHSDEVSGRAKRRNRRQTVTDGVNRPRKA